MLNYQFTQHIMFLFNVCFITCFDYSIVIVKQVLKIQDWTDYMTWIMLIANCELIDFQLSTATYVVTT